MTRANTYHAIFIFNNFRYLTMSKNNGISKIVDRIIADTCKDCEQRCGLCDHGVCQDVVTEIGCFFMFVAEKEKSEEQ